MSALPWPFDAIPKRRSPHEKIVECYCDHCDRRTTQWACAGFLACCVCHWWRKGRGERRPPCKAMVDIQELYRAFPDGASVTERAQVVAAMTILHQGDPNCAICKRGPRVVDARPSSLLPSQGLMRTLGLFALAAALLGMALGHYFPINLIGS